MKTIEEYALDTILAGAESFVEDDIDEDGDLPDEASHEKATDLAYAVIRGMRANPDKLLALAIHKTEAGV